MGHVPNRKKIKLTQEQIETIHNLEREGLLDVEYKYNKAYVSPFLWLSMDAKSKGDFTAALAVYCGNKKKSYVYRVDIYDKRSGKKIAKYSPLSGFEVY